MDQIDRIDGIDEIDRIDEMNRIDQKDQIDRIDSAASRQAKFLSVWPRPAGTLLVSKTAHSPKAKIAPSR